ncbi:hypothetical protein FKM82_005791 [Ascaphus truei]
MIQRSPGQRGHHWDAFLSGTITKTPLMAVMDFCGGFTIYPPVNEDLVGADRVSGFLALSCDAVGTELTRCISRNGLWERKCLQ